MKKAALEAAKKQNESNPALDIFNSGKQEQYTPRTAPEGYKVNPQFVEVKSKRVQLVFQPSIYDRAKAAAEEQGISLNEYIHRLIDDATR